MDMLLEGQRLEALVFDRLLKAGSETSEVAISPQRAAVWKTARLMAVERSAAFKAALDEVLEVASTRAIAVQLLAATQLAFFHYARPEWRPLVDLEIRVPDEPDEMPQELHQALQSHRFLQTDDFGTAGGGQHLPLLERDGVTIRVHRGALPAPGTFPRLLEADALVLELCHEVFTRRFSHSLLYLHDLHVVFTSLKPNWDSILASVTTAPVALETFLTLSVLEKVLETALDTERLRQLGEATQLPTPRTNLLCDLCTTAALEYPATQETRDSIEKQFSEITSPKALFA
jgi:hypothetical protein